MADVLLYLVWLADDIGIDLMEVARAKQAAARSHLPAADFQCVAPDKT